MVRTIIATTIDDTPALDIHSFADRRQALAHIAEHVDVDTIDTDGPMLRVLQGGEVVAVMLED